MEQTGLAAWSGMSSLLRSVGGFCNFSKIKSHCSEEKANAMTRKACVLALRNEERELLLLCGAEVGEMNGGEMQ